MTYKQNCKDLGSVIARLLVVKDVLVNHIPQKTTSQIHSCNEDTVTNIMKLFRKNVNKKHLDYLKNQSSFKKETAEKLFCFLKYESRAPKTGQNRASSDQESAVLALFKEKRGWGAKRSFNALKIRIGITFPQTKGVFKRHDLRRKKVRTAGGCVRSIYDMWTLSVFEIMQVDVKHIADKKALPKEIYDFYKHRKDIPSFQWTYFFPKSRIKLHLYSYVYNSDFGLRGILYVIKYLRSCGIHYPIKVVKDGGPEFTSNSTKKEKVWNYCLSKLNAYTAIVDKRENNFIERSHLTDDYEFYIPQTHRMNSKEDFLTEAHRYIQYFNHKREHQGIENKTPAEHAYNEGVYNIRRIVSDFKPFIIEDQYHALSTLLESELDISEIRDSSGRYIFEKHCSKKKLNESQNVLNFYQKT